MCIGLARWSLFWALVFQAVGFSHSFEGGSDHARPALAEIPAETPAKLTSQDFHDGIKRAIHSYSARAFRADVVSEIRAQWTGAEKKELDRNIKRDDTLSALIPQASDAEVLKIKMELGDLAHQRFRLYLTAIQRLKFEVLNSEFRVVERKLPPLFEGQGEVNAKIPTFKIIFVYDGRVFRISSTIANVMFEEVSKKGDKFVSELHQVPLRAFFPRRFKMEENPSEVQLPNTEDFFIHYTFPPQLSGEGEVHYSFRNPW